MSNTNLVEAMLIRVARWVEDGIGASVEENDIAKKILQLGGKRAVVIADRIMAANMTPDDWNDLHLAYMEITDLIGRQLMTTPSPGPLEIEGQGDANP
jgi:anti-sigma factor RsiW